MELKPEEVKRTRKNTHLLIVPYGIETRLYQ